jgi:hypothetical protein
MKCLVALNWVSKHHILFILYILYSHLCCPEACGTSSGISVWSLLSNECIFNLDCNAPVQDLMFDKNHVSSDPSVTSCLNQCLITQ